MRTIRIKAYKFNELSAEVQETVLNDLYAINVEDFEWWDGVYNDAENIGLKITSFDLDRNRHADGEFIQDAIYTANKIKSEHGQECETYKTAIAFLAERDEIVNNAPKDENGDFEDETELDSILDECEDDFLNSLLNDYAIMLEKESEYLMSKEAIIETIEANEYEFTKEGKQI